MYFILAGVTLLLTSCTLKTNANVETACAYILTSENKQRVIINCQKRSLLFNNDSNYLKCYFNKEDI